MCCVMNGYEAVAEFEGLAKCHTWQFRKCQKVAPSPHKEYFQF